MEYAMILLSSIISGILGVVISTIYYKKAERRKEKIGLITQLFGNRHDITGDKFSEALNSILVVFYDSEKVLKKLKEFHNIVSAKDKVVDVTNDALIDLFKALTSDVKLDFKNLNDNFLLKTFNFKIS